MVKWRRASDENDGPAARESNFRLLEQVFHLLEIKDVHGLSESVLADILYHHREFSQNVHEDWPETFEVCFMF